MVIPGMIGASNTPRRNRHVAAPKNAEYFVCQTPPGSGALKKEAEKNMPAKFFVHVKTRSVMPQSTVHTPMTFPDENFVRRYAIGN